MWAALELELGISSPREFPCSIRHVSENKSAIANQLKSNQVIESACNNKIELARPKKRDGSSLIKSTAQCNG